MSLRTVFEKTPLYPHGSLERGGDREVNKGRYGVAAEEYRDALLTLHRSWIPRPHAEARLVKKLSRFGGEMPLPDLLRPVINEGGKWGPNAETRTKELKWLIEVLGLRVAKLLEMPAIPKNKALRDGILNAFPHFKN